MEEYFQPKIGGKVKIFSLCRKNNILNWLRKGLKKNELTFRTFENMETQASSLKVLHIFVRSVLAIVQESRTTS